MRLKTSFCIFTGYSKHFKVHPCFISSPVRTSSAGRLLDQPKVAATLNISIMLSRTRSPT